MIYSQRRKRFTEQMEDGIAIFANPPANEDKYRPDMDFYYLTGFDEPNAICVLTPNKLLLFVQPKDIKAEIWTGIRYGVEKAREIFGADEAYPVDEFEKALPSHLNKASKIYYHFCKDREFNGKIIKLLESCQSRRQWGEGPYAMYDSGEILHEMRLIKDDMEIGLIRKAVSLTSDGICSAMKALEAGMYEYEIEALVHNIYRKGGGNGSAYPPIIGSGPNANILHYNVNSRQIQDGDLVLIDTGAEYGYYDADVTRTVPANGKFTNEQKAIYNAVLHAQLKLIESIKPGNTYEDYSKAAFYGITEGLVGIGLLLGNVDDLVEKEEYARFYVHGAGHWVGLDTHDVGKYKVNGKSRVFEPGMIITPDTAIYILEGMENVDPEYWNIGIRIEDDALVTENGCEILSSDIPKTIDEIEAFMRK